MKTRKIRGHSIIPSRVTHESTHRSNQGRSSSSSRVLFFAELNSFFELFPPRLVRVPNRHVRGEVCVCVFVSLDWLTMMNMPHS
mmetsp:Transcript_42295/g.83414  ORF Transcript_42295/g.83414 Transcript_42295/m.83414 type:complete len:84 (-) Transcript_42295:100-351(-)